MFYINLIAISIFFGVSVHCEVVYKIPKPTFDVLKPYGFRVSLSDHVGISEALFSSTLLMQPTKKIPLKQSPGRWFYENRVIALEPRQIFRYSIYVKYNKKWLETTDQVYEIPCKQSDTIERGRPACQGQLIFHDDFSTLNHTLWNREVRIPLDVEDAEFVVYGNRSENLYIEDGKLVIQPKMIDQIPGYDTDSVRTGELDLGSECTAYYDRERECVRHAGLFRILPPLFSASISTKESFSFRYGKVEVRAKLPKGDWLLPLITLEPLHKSYGIVGHASGQMRVAFIRGNSALNTKDGTPIDGSYLSGGVVLQAGEEGRDMWLGKVHGAEHWGNDFHTYSLTWRENSVSLAYDGQIYASICTKFNINPRSPSAPLDKEFYITLALSAGGISDFPDGSISSAYVKPWLNNHPKGELMFWKEREKWSRTWNTKDARLVVDYVKVWAL